MIDANDAVYYAIQQLERAVEGGKPIVFWCGSGVSAWRGYPLWAELAHICHQELLSSENYDRNHAATLIAQQAYPRFFSYVRKSHPDRYFRLLKREFHPRSTTPVYERFLGVLRRYAPAKVAVAARRPKVTWKNSMTRPIPVRMVATHPQLVKALSLIASYEAD